MGATNGASGASGAGVEGSGLTIANSGSISGATGANAITFTGGSNTLTLQTGWSLSGGIGVTGSLTFNQSISTTLANIVTGTGSVIQNGTGTLTLSGANTYTGGTIVNGGILNVTGSIGDPIVNAGGVLMGTGTVDATQINAGGTFAPGNGTAGTSMIVAGNLAFASGAVYLVQINPSAAAFAAVTGTTTIGGGTVNAVFASGNYASRQYTILTSTGALGGTFASLTNTNLPAGFTDYLSYGGNAVFLNLTAGLGGGGLSPNQHNPANAINSFFNGGGTLPPGFLGLFDRTGANLGNALSQLSGEAATDAANGAFQMMTQFLDLMVDPSSMSGGGAGGREWLRARAGGQSSAGHRDGLCERAQSAGVQGADLRAALVSLGCWLWRLQQDQW